MKISTLFIVIACVLVTGLSLGGIVYLVKNKTTEPDNGLTNETEEQNQDVPSKREENEENVESIEPQEETVDNVREEPEIFYYSDNETIVGNVNGAIRNGETLSLEKRKKFWCIGANNVTVAITANPNAPDFFFIVNDEFVSLKDITDFTECFNITTVTQNTPSEYRFTLSVNSSIESIGQTILKNNDVTIMEDKDFSEIAFFLLNIIIGEDTFSFPLKVDISREAHSLVLEPKEMFF